MTRFLRLHPVLKFGNFPTIVHPPCKGLEEIKFSVWNRAHWLILGLANPCPGKVLCIGRVGDGNMPGWGVGGERRLRRSWASFSASDPAGEDGSSALAAPWAEVGVHVVRAASLSCPPRPEACPGSPAAAEGDPPRLQEGQGGCKGGAGRRGSPRERARSWLPEAAGG